MFDGDWDTYASYAGYRYYTQTTLNRKNGDFHEEAMIWMFPTKPKIASSSLTPAIPFTNENLTLAYDIYLTSGETDSSIISWYNQDGLIAGQNTTVLDSSLTSIDDVVTVQIIPSNGTFNGTAVNNTVTVQGFYALEQSTYDNCFDFVTGGDGYWTQKFTTTDAFSIRSIDVKFNETDFGGSGFNGTMYMEIHGSNETGNTPNATNYGTSTILSEEELNNNLTDTTFEFLDNVALNNGSNYWFVIFAKDFWILDTVEICYNSTSTTWNGTWRSNFDPDVFGYATWFAQYNDTYFLISEGTFNITNSTEIAYAPNWTAAYSDLNFTSEPMMSGNFSWNYTEYNITGVGQGGCLLNVTNTDTRTAHNLQAKIDVEKAWYDWKCNDISINTTFQTVTSVPASSSVCLNCTLDLININQTYVEWNLTENYAYWNFTYTWRQS